MNEKNAHRSTTRTPSRRGAATPSRDGVHRIVVPLHLRLSAPELIRVLLAAPAELDLEDLAAVRARSSVADVLTLHGYDVLHRPAPDASSQRYQDARRAIRRAYGSRFIGTPGMQALADPLSEVLAKLEDGLP